MKRDLTKLFKNMCCSQCGNDFEDDSFDVLREEDDFAVLQVHCVKCGKSFGVAFLGMTGSADIKGASDEDLAFDVYDGPNPITQDEVLNAHKFIKSLDAGWQKHIPDKFKK